MSPSFWITQGQQCAFLGVLFYSIVLGGWLNERWKRRHPGWTARLPGEHRAPTMGAPRFRDEPLTPWGAAVGVKVSEGEVEIL